jgi:hypothetical protein
VKLANELAMTRTNNTRQMTVPNSDSEHIHSTPWGDIMGAKQEAKVRVIFQNCGGLPLKASHESQERLVRCINHNAVDILGLAEVNINWARLPVQDRIPLRYFGIWERLASKTSYIPDGTEAYQVGGTVMLAFADSVSRMTHNGQDDLGYGRWTWMRFRGTNGQ